MTHRTLHDHPCHHGWDRDLPPALEVTPGTTVSFRVADASGGQLGAGATLADLQQLDFGRVNPLSGPVFVEGAEPGDALVVDLLEFAPSGTGWTANIPGFGLLADEFTDPYLKVWTYDRNVAEFAPGIRVPVQPFPGTLGNAPGEPGPHSVVPPRRVGGNLDIRDLRAGTRLSLPVEVPGALFSIGDTHAAQGDGEVCGTAIESAMDVTLRLSLVKGANFAFPRFRTPGPVTRHIDHLGYDVTTGVGSDLLGASRDAVREMIDHLGREYGITPYDAYLLCSVCADLRISEVVDLPNYLVSLYFPRAVFS